MCFLFFFFTWISREPNFSVISTHATRIYYNFMNMLHMQNISCFLTCLQKLGQSALIIIIIILAYLSMVTILSCFFQPRDLLLPHMLVVDTQHIHLLFFRGSVLVNTNYHLCTQKQRQLNSTITVMHWIFDHLDIYLHQRIKERSQLN